MKAIDLRMRLAKFTVAYLTGRMAAATSGSLSNSGLPACGTQCENRCSVSSFGKDGIVDLFKELDLDYKGDPMGKIGNSSPVVISHDTVIVGPALTPGGRVNNRM